MLCECGNCQPHKRHICRQRTTNVKILLQSYGFFPVITLHQSFPNKNKLLLIYCCFAEIIIACNIFLKAVEILGKSLKQPLSSSDVKRSKHNGFPVTIQISSIDEKCLENAEKIHLDKQCPCLNLLLVCMESTYQRAMNRI